jgi:hypothetical protein
MGANDYAIVVGISKYPALGDLDGPEADAKDFFDWLVDPKGGAVPNDPDHISLLLSSNYPPAPVQLKAKPQVSDIEEVFDNYYIKGKEEAVVGDRLYLYFAGHGFAPSLEDAALLMANAARGMTGYHLPGRKYANWFRQAAFFKEVVLFMDCCRESYQLSAPREVPYEKLNGDKPATPYFAFATQWSRATREGPWGENGATRGLFTLALLAGLRGGAAQDANGQVTGEALESFTFNFIRKKFSEWDEKEREKAKAAGEAEPTPEEHPDPEFFYNKMTPILLGAPVVKVRRTRRSGRRPAPAASGAQYTVRIATRNGGTFTLSTNGQPDIAPSAKLADRWEWTLAEAGLYKVTRDDGASKLFEVIGEKKEAIDVVLD